MLNIFKKYRDIREITEDEMRETIKTVENVVVLDVRSTQEFNEGHILGAINIPVYELKKKAKQTIRDKNSVIIAYCTAGIRSRKAIKILKDLGYRNLYNIKDGINI